MRGDQSPQTKLNERSRYLLRALVERYIRDGQPVGSRTLARDTGSDLSPATIRNVMADLEDMGYLCAPHTSAGRIPTVRGYRFFVDSLLQIKPLHNPEIEKLWKHLTPHQGTTDLVQGVSDLLSGVTHMVGVVMVPRRQSSMLNHVEFLPISDNRVLAILVINEQEVQNRVIHTKRAYSAAELQQAANYLNAQFAGKDIQQVRDSLVREMRSTREAMDALMQTVLEMADQTFSFTEEEQEDYVLAGQTNIMGVDELADVDRLRNLFEAFSHKQDILHLLDQCLHAQGVQIFIGSEAGCEGLEACSVVTAPYSVEDKLLGVLGVIGPTRMAYDRVIPVVDMTAKLLASALNSRD